MCLIKDQNLPFLILVYYIQDEGIWVKHKSAKAQFPHQYKMLWRFDYRGTVLLHVSQWSSEKCKQLIETAQCYYIFSRMAKWKGQKGPSANSYVKPLLVAACGTADQNNHVGKQALSNETEQAELWSSISSLTK